MAQDAPTPDETDPPAAEDEGPGLERTITLTDAVVAIAMTLLVLPLVEISGDVDPTDLASFWSDNRDLLISFAISFVVIYAFWTGHGTIYQLLARSRIDGPPALGTLNMLWLLAIAFLPFPTALTGRDVNVPSVVLYLGTMLIVSALMVVMSLLVHQAVGAPKRPIGVWLTTAVFAVATAVAFFSPSEALYVLLLLIPVRVIEGRLEHAGRRPARRAQPK